MLNIVIFRLVTEYFRIVCWLFSDNLATWTTRLTFYQLFLCITRSNMHFLDITLCYAFCYSSKNSISLCTDGGRVGCGFHINPFKFPAVFTYNDRCDVKARVRGRSYYLATFLIEKSNFLSSVGSLLKFLCIGIGRATSLFRKSDFLQIIGMDFIAGKGGQVFYTLFLNIVRVFLVIIVA